VADVVYFLGFREDVPRLLASLDLFVMSSRMEGLGTSIMDAMAARLPVVATMAGGIPEVVIHRETGLLVPPRDPQALAQAILKLSLDRGLAGRLARRGHEVVHEKFSAEAMGPADHRRLRARGRGEGSASWRSADVAESRAGRGRASSFGLRPDLTSSIAWSTSSAMSGSATIWT
jgi:hypothetical protein